MHSQYALPAPLKRRLDASYREDDFFHMINGDVNKRRHIEPEENYNICNKSLEFLPSFHAEPEDREAMNQRGANELLYDNFFPFPVPSKINYKIEEYLEIASDQTTEDSFIKDFPQTQENFSDILLYWEYEEDDLLLVREIFYFNEWSQKDAKNNCNLKTMMGFQSNFSPFGERKMNEFKNPWLEKVNVQISDIELRYYLMGQIFKMLNEERPMMKIS